MRQRWPRRSPGRCGTGVAVLRGGRTVHLADEPTGGTHLTLVLAGAHRIPFAQAEAMKKDAAQAAHVLQLVTPVIERIGTIVRKHLAGQTVPAVYLVGGTACLPGTEAVLARDLGLPVFKPQQPMLITPLGIALAAAEAGEAGGP